MQTTANIVSKSFVVAFRTGGTENFKWSRVLDVFFTREAAQSKVDELNRAGFPTLVFNKAQLDAIGLPETFSGDADVRPSAGPFKGQRHRLNVQRA